MKLKSLIAVLLMCSVSAYAAKVVWTGDVNNWDWNEEGNFQGGIPTTNDVVEIPSGKVVKLKDKASVDLVASLSQLHVAEGAVFFTYDSGLTTIKGLYGAGLITNEVTQSYQNLLIDGISDFSGRIAGSIYCQSKGKVMLTGVDNVFAAPFSIRSTSTGLRDFEELAQRNIGYTGVMKIGMKGEPSSVGVDNDIRTMDYGGGLLYLGEGEITDKSFSVLYPSRGLSFIDGGATGGLVWKGDIILDDTGGHKGMGILGLIGSNSTPCVVAGNVKPNADGSETYNFFFEKAGTGTWRFADTPDNKAQRNFFTSMAIKNGTLQFDSMEEAGVPCALGLATNLTALYYGARNDAAHPGPYAYWLGAPGKMVTFEFTGTNGAYATRRHMALEGDVKLRNDTPHPWRFSGISPISPGSKILYLSGQGNGENEIAGISDSATSPISIVKEGSGAWTLNGSNTFSGSVSVNSGTLSIRRNPGAYTWFKWTIKNKSISESAYLYLTEFSISDKDGNCISQGLTFTNNWCGTLPGQISLPRVGSYSISNDRHIINVVNGTTIPVNICYYKDGTGELECPVLNESSTYLPVLMRLPTNSSPAKYYDVCIHYGRNATDKNRRGNPNAWTLEASADGIYWDELHSVVNKEDPDDSYKWTFADKKYANTKETESGVLGYEIASRPNVTISPNFSNTVSVAAGATLKAIGEVVLSSMEIDAVNAGTVDGFSFAESGELNVKNVSGNGVLGGTFLNSTNLGNLKNWSVSVNGSPMPGKMISVSESGALSLVSRGLVFSVR